MERAEAFFTPEAATIRS